VRVLVTGAGGYVGSHACKALARAGFEPIGLDNMQRSGIKEMPWGPLEVADICDRPALDAVLRKYRPGAAMHFAAYAYVGESVTAPDVYYRNNVGGSVTLLSALHDAGIDKLIFSGTCAVYGMPIACPMVESHPQAPISPYGASKQMVERILLDFEAAFGMRHVVLRYFNAAGADPDGEIGECHDPETHAIPLAIQTALGQRPAFEVFGSDYPTPDGSAIRDYVHVSDLANAHVRSLQYLLQGGASVALNLGTGRGHSVLEVVKAIESTTRRKVTLREAPRRPGDPPILVADPSRAEAVLDWRPTITVITEIVQTAVSWEVKKRKMLTVAPVHL
jgi:UDP-arabinose 4-epimerase